MIAQTPPIELTREAEALRERLERADYDRWQAAEERFLAAVRDFQAEFHRAVHAGALSVETTEAAEYAWWVRAIVPAYPRWSCPDPAAVCAPDCGTTRCPWCGPEPCRPAPLARREAASS